MGLILLVLSGCGEKAVKTPSREKTAEEALVREKYGKSLSELPVRKLVVISPHNVDIEKEYEAAFSLHHAVNFGERVDMEWRDVGGGASAILHHLRNVYAASGRSGIDIVWGGGEYNFQRMAEEDLLHDMTIPEEVLEHIPEFLGGIRLHDPKQRWCGSAVSGFGFLYNKSLIDRMKLKKPERWEDMGAPDFFGLVGFADPTQSGSAAASYEMIVQSGANWQTGWEKLLSILGNAKKFYAGAGDAAEAIPSGEVAIAACIDFYGINRVAKYPDTLVYVSPKGQTSFNPDPIAILKNPPDPILAQRLVDFVLSVKGQALWALPVGHEDGPAYASLGRQPIRRDVYEKYAGQLPPMIINPYGADQTMAVDKKLWDISYGLLRQLVYAAAVKNLDGLKAAKKTLIDQGFDPDRLKFFNALPENISTLEKLEETDRLLQDKKQQDIIVSRWIAFFREKYQKVAQ
jgi:ABC-type Fe3+ transport system substrate-binding protein